jgi:hypothetical protein
VPFTCNLYRYAWASASAPGRLDAAVSAAAEAKENAAEAGEAEAAAPARAGMAAAMVGLYKLNQV